MPDVETKGISTSSQNVVEVNSAAIKAAVELIDNAIAGNEMQVDVISGGGGTQYSDGDVRGTATGTLAMIDDGVNIQSISGDATGKLNVNISNSPAVTVSSGSITETNSNSIKTAVESINTKLVSGTDIGDVTINNGAGVNAVNIQDGGNTITVDGSVTANAGTNLNTSLLALESGNLATIAGDTTSIDGKITACNTGAVVVSSGSITATNVGTSLISGRKTVTTAGTAEVLKANTSLTQGIIIMALKTNTNNVFVGDSNVDKTTDKQYELEPGEATAIAVNNTNLIYVDVTTDGEGVQFIGS